MVEQEQAEEAFPALPSASTPAALGAASAGVGRARASYADLLSRRANHLRSQQQQQLVSEPRPKPTEESPRQPAKEEAGKEGAGSPSAVTLVRLDSSSFYRAAATAAAAAAATDAAGEEHEHEEEGKEEAAAVVEAEAEQGVEGGGPVEDPGRRMLLMAQVR